MRALVIDEAARAKASAVIAHAEDHHYHPGPGQPIPGEEPRFVAKIGTYRVVFTYTHADGMVWRHMSVSIPGRKLPNQVAVFALAELFGFTGHDLSTHHMTQLPDGWVCDVNQIDNCVFVAQAIEAEITKAAMN